MQEPREGVDLYLFWLAILFVAPHLHRQCGRRHGAVDVCTVHRVHHWQHTRLLAKAFLSIYSRDQPPTIGRNKQNVIQDKLQYYR